jgi:biopolymer transport protein ExbD
MGRRKIPEINAGSMADIAFLLLIFFLVTTTMNQDRIMTAKLPQWISEPIENPIITKEKNLFKIIVNKDDMLLVEGELMQIKDLRQAVIDFLDNGGGTGEDACSYCQGKKDPKSSDNPAVKAVISLKNDRGTSNKVYMSIQNEVTAAYNFLRNRSCIDLHKKEWAVLEEEYKDAELGPKKAKLKEKVKKIKELWPKKVTESINK